MFLFYLFCEVSFLSFLFVLKLQFHFPYYFYKQEYMNVRAKKY